MSLNPTLYPTTLYLKNSLGTKVYVLVWMSCKMLELFSVEHFHQPHMACLDIQYITVQFKLLLVKQSKHVLYCIVCSNLSYLGDWKLQLKKDPEFCNSFLWNRCFSCMQGFVFDSLVLKSKPCRSQEQSLVHQVFDIWDTTQNLYRKVPNTPASFPKNKRQTCTSIPWFQRFQFQRFWT